jgi:hypothetical protein
MDFGVLGLLLLASYGMVGFGVGVNRHAYLADAPCAVSYIPYQYNWQSGLCTKRCEYCKVAIRNKWRCSWWCDWEVVGWCCCFS